MTGKKKQSFVVTTRRGCLKKLIVLGGMISFGMTKYSEAGPMQRQGQSFRAKTTVFRAINGRPEENLVKIMEMMGGIEKVIDKYDVVVIKPNVQWWNQGAPNLSVVKCLVEMIFARKGGFNGEVALAENCHRGSRPWERAGWANTFERNCGMAEVRNFSDLGMFLKKIYGRRFSVCHWIDVDKGWRRVSGPKDGEGYVYCDGTNGVPLIACDNGLEDPKRRATIMTYPIFQTDRGTVIDFRNGVWAGGSYTDQPLKFINLAALNHHSTYCGMTSAIKNFMGISDLSGGPDPMEGGRLTSRFYNFHSFPFDKWASGPAPGMLGKEIGTFMRSIRRADLNITTAEFIGLASRIKAPVAHTRAVLASRDPVALDYHAAKYILYPNSRIPIHSPDNPTGPLLAYLKKCAEISGFTLDEKEMEVVSFDFTAKSMQDNGRSPVLGEIQWGNDVRTLLKYLHLRFIS